MKRTIIAILFLLIAFCAKGQWLADAPLEVWRDPIDQTTHKLNVRQQTSGIYTLVVDFHHVENMDIPRFVSAAIRRSGTIMTLHPADPDREWNYSFASKWMPGVVNPTGVDSTFVYRLPIKAGERKKARTMRNAGSDSLTVDYSGVAFDMNRGDTVYAARRGVVLYVVDEYDPAVKEDATETGAGAETETESETKTEASGWEYNSIDVQHDDGTIARYGSLERGGTPVRPGTTVFAGMPIARAGTLDGDQYRLYFNVYYQTDNLSEISSLGEHTVKYHYIEPTFGTSAGEAKLANATYYLH
ncbi:MAG: M23 family metallopeptidase [Alistipes sp.]|jgi:murein DD-endopeptidase MepM/ murein hydrolase activator NlpD|nr:M23 family metallopeptidase [Alistipes sp.]